MAQAKKKTATRTKKTTTQRKTGSRANTRTSKKKQAVTEKERMHIIIVSCLAIIAGILFGVNAAIMLVV